MPSAYLTSDDLAEYGLPSTTTAADITRASASVDSYLGRVEGMVWAPDSRGLPCYMAAMSPSFTGKANFALTAGVPATVAYAPALVGGSDMLGEIIVVDRGTPELTEALVIEAFDSTAGTVTLSPSINNHAVNATLDAGMVIVEERPIAPKRSQARFSNWPVARLLSGCGRYSYGRRSDQVAGLYNDYNLIAVLQTFGGPPQWVPWDVRLADISVSTGEVWVPAGMMLAYYTEVRMRYVAGYPAAGLPSAIKQATANIISNAASADYAPPNFKVAQAGGSKFERFTDSQLDTDTKGLLETFRQKLFF